MLSAREIDEAIIKRDLLLSRVSASEREKLLKIISSLTKELSAQMYELDDFVVMSPSKRMRIIKKFIKDGEKTISESFSGYGKSFSATLAEIIVFEAGQTGRMLNQAAVAAATETSTVGTVNLNPESMTLTTEQAEMLLKDSWVTNKSVSEILEGQEATFVNEFKKRVRKGYVSGQTNAQIARELKGYTDKDGILHQGLDGATAKSAERMVRTSCLAMANTARLEMYRKNADVIRCVKWLAALDLRTCIHCAAIDGKYWDLDGQPMGHNIPFESPPVHQNCRCTTVPVLKSFSEIDDNGNVVETMAPDTRASMNGQVSNQLDFGQWFESLGEEEQEKYLGAKRWKLYKEGKITFSSLIDQNGRGMTIEEIRRASHVFVGNYAPDMEKALWELDDKSRANGMIFTEHGLTTFYGRLSATAEKKRIPSFEAAVDTHRNGAKYLDNDGGLARFKNNISLHYTKNDIIKTIIVRRKAGKNWEKL